MSCNTGLHNAITKILNNKPWFKYKQGDNVIEILDSPNGKININTSTGAAIALANTINAAVNNGYKNIGNVVEKRTNYKTNRGYVEIVATSKQLDLINAQDEKEIAELQDYVNAEIDLGKIKDYNPLNVEEFNNLSDEEKSEILLKEQEKKPSPATTTGNVYNKEIKNKYFNNGNVQKSNVILQKIAKSSHPLANLAKHLLKYTNINNVNIVLDSVESFNLDDIKNSRAYYSSFDNLIKIAQFGKYKNVQQIETILLHEILHALSYKAIRENTKANEKFNELYKKSISILGKYNPETKEGFYGNYTIDEFFVGIFTDSQFIKALSNIPSEKSGYRNLFEEIMDFILNILGIKKETTLYTEAYAVATNIISDYQDYTDYLTKPFETTNDYFGEQFDRYSIKPGVEELFESNPELATIGTQEQYSQYLDTVFPDSKVKDIVYHGGTVNDIFTKENIGKSTINSNKNDLGQPNAFYFSSSKESAKTYGNIKSVLLNIKNPEILNQYFENNGFGLKRKNKFNDVQKLDLKNKDGFILENIFDAKYLETLSTKDLLEDFNGLKEKKLKEKIESQHGDTIGVFEPEQIHILGSKQDIERFKEYMQFKNNVKDYFNLSEEDSNFVTDISNINFNC